MFKSLKDISWNVSEEEYRADKALSYSTLAKYEREGFSKLGSLFDKVESPSLTFGSAVDSIITGGDTEFNSRFIVAEFPSVPDSIIPIVKALYNEYKDTFSSLYDIPDKCVIAAASIYNYQNNWRPETRVRVIKEKASEYYKLLYISDDKIILSSDTYRDVMNTVSALKTSKATRKYFEQDNPWDNIERLYQLKFKSVFEDVEYRCMMDLCVVDHNKKLIIPVDLKTSSKEEYNFYKSFIDWRYDIQARLYWRILKDNLKRDPYFKNFTLANYRFIVVNKVTLNPLVWNFASTKSKDPLTIGRSKQIILRDPETIGKELHGYINSRCKVPNGINIDGINNLEYWLDEL